MMGLVQGDAESWLVGAECWNVPVTRIVPAGAMCIYYDKVQVHKHQGVNAEHPKVRGHHKLQSDRRPLAQGTSLVVE